MKLKTKINIWSTGMMLLILLVLMTIIYVSFSRLVYSTEVSQLQADVDALVSTFNTSDPADPSDVLRGYVPPNGLIQAKREGTDLIPSIQDPDIADDFPEELPEQSGTLKVEDDLFAYVTAPIIWTDGEIAELVVAQSLEEVVNNARTLGLVLVTVSLLAMIPIFVSSVVLGRVVTKPITDLTKTMTRIQKSGQFEKLPATDSSKDEVGQMGSTFNSMMELLEENYTKQEEFVSNASHELKTPLTVIGSYAKLLERQGMEDPKLAEEGLLAIRTETDRMKALIEQLLHIARRSETQLVWEPVDLIELARQTAAAMSTSYNRDFQLVSSATSVLVTTDLAKIKQIMYILLDNARKYSSDRIELIVKNGNIPMLQIRDYGIGIPKESIPYVFDRFYRVDKARSRETGGFGLGLSLAKQLADAMGVSLEIESEEDVGTTISIVFSADFNVQEVQSKQEGWS
ncbi:Signal transduction histidine-protein kinase ArlS [Planococcus massiliensis]|uniref:histidine kinase n=1 Tax=Planococcus massiliensis TaxID=1499687 RepID=A0A098EJ40_9BACL|nr:HAMP domain-containing sensor histidine kinase [Planococcus massiliensis]CEG22293.1 Signal transduction histidine-protein kinase ArlS [Planococcus massiliensis]